MWITQHSSHYNPVNICHFEISISSQAALENVRRTRDGKDEEITTLQKEVEVLFIIHF